MAYRVVLPSGPGLIVAIAASLLMWRGIWWLGRYIVSVWIGPFL